MFSLCWAPAFALAEYLHKLKILRSYCGRGFLMKNPKKYLRWWGCSISKIYYLKGNVPELPPLLLRQWPVPGS
jgi:hypothetical protein